MLKMSQSLIRGSAAISAGNWPHVVAGFPEKPWINTTAQSQSWERIGITSGGADMEWRIQHPKIQREGWWMHKDWAGVQPPTGRGCLFTTLGGGVPWKSLKSDYHHSSINGAIGNQKCPDPG